MIQETLIRTGLPVQYQKLDSVVDPPYLVYVGSGQEIFEADNTLYWRENIYRVEYYFIQKNEELENTIEEILLQDGYIFTKSEDIYIEDEEISVIYYYL